MDEADIVSRHHTLPVAGDDAPDHTPPPAPTGKYSQLASLLESGLTVSVIISVALLGFLLYDARERAQDAASQSQMMLAEALSGDIEHTLETVDRSLSGAARAVRLPGIWELPADIRTAAIFGAAPTEPKVPSLFVIDRDGKLIADARDPTPSAANFADRAYFRDHQANPDLALHISGPITGRLYGRPALIFSRRVNDEKGDFAGIVSGGVLLSYFNDLLASVGAGEGGVIGLVLTDGKVITRAPFKAEAVGFDMSGTSLFRRLMSAPTGTYTDRAISDGVERLVAYRKVGRFPVIVAFSRSTDVIFADWAHMASTLGVGLLVLCGLKVCAIWVLRRERIRRVHAQQLADVAAAALVAVNRTLEERVDAALAAQAKAREKLETGQRLEALGKLAGGIAHDINNVLQIITGACSLIADRQHRPTEVQRLATLALGAADRGSAVTRRLLAFARRGNLRTEHVNLAELLEDVQELLNHTLCGRSTIELSIPPTLPTILIDRMQLETVVVNLVTNARDATPNGGTIIIAAQQEVGDGEQTDAGGLPAGPYVRLSVQDHGIGMDAKTLVRAVEPFFSTKGVGNGTGLGLSMAKGFAEQSGGKLDIASRVGEGTTVSLWLPAACAQARPQESRSPAWVPSRTGGATIFVVDDDQQARQLTCEWLGANHFKTHQFGSGEAALAALDDGIEIDLLLTDFAMPGMDGIGLTQAVRKHAPGMPVIILTGDTGAIAMETIERAAGDDCTVLHKPIRPAELADRISMELRRLPVVRSSFPLLAATPSAGEWPP